MIIKITLYLINAITGLLLAKYGVVNLGSMIYGEAVRLFLFIEISAVLLGLGYPYIVEKNNNFRIHKNNIYPMVMVPLITIYSFLFVPLVFEKILEEYLWLVVAVCIYSSVFARSVTRYMIAQKRPNISICIQIIETKVPLFLCMILLNCSGNYKISLLSYFMAKIILVLVPLTMNKTKPNNFSVNVFDYSVWMYDLTILFVANSFVIYDFYFSENGQPAQTWIYFIIANSVATIVINASRISVLSDMWAGNKKEARKKTEVLFLSMALIISIILGEFVVKTIFGVDGGVWILVGTLISWMLYSMIGPKFEELFVKNAELIPFVGLMILGATLFSYSLVATGLVPIYILFLIPLILQVISKNVLRYIDKR